MDAKEVLKKYFIWGIYIGSDKTSWDCWNWVSGYLAALRATDLLTEDEYLRAGKLNKAAYEAFKHSDNDE